MNATKPTPKQAQGYLKAMQAIAGAIHDLGQTPSGHLYASCMNVMSLQTYEGIIDRLVGAGLVQRAGNYMLTWVGPKIEK